MQKEIQILYPPEREQTTRILNGTLYVSGTVSERMGVTAVLLNSASTEVGSSCGLYYGKPLYRSYPTGEPPVYPWVARMKGLEGATGSCTLKVTGTDQVTMATRTVHLGGAAEQKTPTKRPKVYNVFITSHADDADISDQARVFVASGTMVAHSITSATMNNIPALFISEDWNTETWAALWILLPSGTYTLTVVDSANHAAVVTGLTIT